MPRNGSGVYTLPVGYEAVTDETAEAAQHNSPLEDLASDANAARPIVAGGTGASSESAARANLGLAIGTNVQAYNANLASLSGLTLEAGKMLYATAADTLALTDLSDHVRTNILPAADGDELWDAIGLGLVAQSAKSDLTDADDIDIGGFYILTAGTANSPSANDCSAIVAREDADNITVTATDAVTGDVYTRSKVSGAWGGWGRMARSDELPQQIATYDYSGNVNEIVFTDLGDWDTIELSFVALATATKYVSITVSADNGATYETDYQSNVMASDGNSQGTTDIVITMDIGNIHGTVKLSNMQETVIASGALYRTTGAGNVPAGRGPVGVAINAIKLNFSSAVTAGSIRVNGIVRAAVT